jgi:hypothetical protein
MYRAFGTVSLTLPRLSLTRIHFLAVSDTWLKETVAPTTDSRF